MLLSAWAPDVALANGWNTEETSALVQTWCALGLSKEEILNAALKNTETHGAPGKVREDADPRHGNLRSHKTP